MMLVSIIIDSLKKSMEVKWVKQMELKCRHQTTQFKLPAIDTGVWLTLINHKEKISTFMNHRIEIRWGTYITMFLG